MTPTFTWLAWVSAVKTRHAIQRRPSEALCVVTFHWTDNQHTAPFEHATDQPSGQFVFRSLPSILSNDDESVLAPPIWWVAERGGGGGGGGDEWGCCFYFVPLQGVSDREITLVVDCTRRAFAERSTKCHASCWRPQRLTGGESGCPVMGQ